MGLVSHAAHREAGRPFDKRIGPGLIDAGDRLEPAFPVAECHRPETQFRNDKSGSSQSTVAHPLYSLPKIRGGGQFRDLHLADT